MKNHGPFFTEKARAAAAQARRVRAALKVESKGGYEVFVVRPDNRYSWQIRQYGGVIVSASDASFDTPAKALEAGKVALGALAEEMLPDPVA